MQLLSFCAGIGEPILWPVADGTVVRFVQRWLAGLAAPTWPGEWVADDPLLLWAVAGTHPPPPEANDTGALCLALTERVPLTLTEADLIEDEQGAWPPARRMALREQLSLLFTVAHIAAHTERSATAEGKTSVSAAWYVATFLLLAERLCPAVFAHDIPCPDFTENLHRWQNAIPAIQQRAIDAALECVDRAAADEGLPAWASPAGEQPATRAENSPGRGGPSRRDQTAQLFAAAAQTAAQRCHWWFQHSDATAGLLRTARHRLPHLQVLERQFQAAVEEAKLDAMAEFAAGTGHEINNPLANINTLAQVLLTTVDGPEQRRALAAIKAQVARAHEMIADSRAFARPPQLEPEEIDAVSLVGEVLAEVAEMARDRQIATSAQCDAPQDKPLTLVADRAALHVALGAVCRNAVEAVGRDGEVAVRIEADGRWLTFLVDDTGPGLSEHQRVHAFDPYYASRQAGRGLGLGLSKCWRIVRLHGGEVDIANRAEGGARVRIRLPRNP